MYKTMDNNNYGIIKEVEKLENRTYQVIGDLHYIHHIGKVRPDLIEWSNITNIAITEKAEELQKFTSDFKDVFNDYKFIFI